MQPQSTNPELEIILDQSAPIGVNSVEWLLLQVELILIHAHYKCATRRQLAQHPSAEVLSKLNSQLQAAGFIISVDTDTSINVADTEEHLQQLHSIFSGNLSAADADRPHGELSGFPATAIDAFVAHGASDQPGLPLEVRQTPAVAFAGFMFSREHWRTELKTSQRWAETIRKVSPHIYKEYLQAFTRHA
jgi:hypothetical protein